jgi:lysophospholipase L1-like esterase
MPVRHLQKRRRVKQGALFFGSLALYLGVAEVLARYHVPDAYYVWPPNFTRVFEPDPDIIPGIRGPSRLTINAIGIRGDPFTEAQRHRVLAVGGSTTICTYLDDREAWPYLVQQRLGAVLGPGKAWVGNVGRPGHTTAQHVLQAEKLLKQHPEIDAVLLLVGINDLLLHIARMRDAEAARGQPSEGGSETGLARAFSLFPVEGDGFPWYTRTGIGRWWTTRRWRVPEWTRQDPDGRQIAVWRTYRKEASALRETLPDLSGPLRGYARNLNRIVHAARVEGARVIFLTQPTLWRDGLSRAEVDLLWGGGPPLDRMRSGEEYYSIAALAAGMKLYNETLLGICGQRRAECFDLARELPQSEGVFWDDAHFTEEGARQVARLVAEYLLARPPLIERRSD